MPRLNLRTSLSARSIYSTCLTLALLLSSFRGEAFAESPENNANLAAWLNAQTNIQTWSADFIQTRTLKSLTQPLTATGHVWFAAPNRFRWELGHPPQTIAVRQPTQLLVVYPKLKRAERYPLDSDQAGPWKDTLALLDAGFPRSRAEVESRFNILAQATTDGVHEITLQPKAEAARRIMPQIRIAFATNDFSLHSTELQFADGSTMQNVFTNAVLNPKIDESVFRPPLGEDYKIIEPFRK
ncbi:MAG: LolA family protein [Pedosphaera sp.]|nr:LolA family protein [Pedosphaera sp.]